MDPVDRVANLAETAAKAAKISGASAGSSPFLAWLVENSRETLLLVGLGGFVISLATFGMSWYYNERRLKLMEMQVLKSLENKQ